MEAQLVAFAANLVITFRIPPILFIAILEAAFIKDSFTTLSNPWSMPARSQTEHVDGLRLDSESNRPI